LKRIETALISVYNKDGLEHIVSQLHQSGVKIYSTGGTYDFILKLGIEAMAIESLTEYPSILGGRVKTLHPKVFGGILGRRHLPEDVEQMEQYGIPPFDLVVVDLYPFEETVRQTTESKDIIEKIDIGGISLIRAAAKNFAEVLVVPSIDYYQHLLLLLKEKQGLSSMEDRARFASYGFAVSSHYDTAIFDWMNKGYSEAFRKSSNQASILRYGENPQQKGIYFGKLGDVFDKLHGKELSYNNLLDLDAGLSLLSEFKEPTFAILKHNNACGLACRNKLSQAYADALAGDPVSAFGGVLFCNQKVDEETATAINQLFFEIIAAPDYEINALQLLRSKKNRVILRLRDFDFPDKQFKSVLNGILQQDRDKKSETVSDFKLVTSKKPDGNQYNDLVFANIVAKHTRSNAIVLAKNMQLVGSGIGQTSRVDALKQCIAKARENEFDLEGAVLASDAFFPFSDSVELAAEAGIAAVVQPGGSVRDQESIDACNTLGLSMVFTGTRHFKH
jgi:phosphoribosylaminoimidazolecarboxamide formyltransferase / IMP cyclohydrolase